MKRLESTLLPNHFYRVRFYSFWGISVPPIGTRTLDRKYRFFFAEQAGRAIKLSNEWPCKLDKQDRYTNALYWRCHDAEFQSGLFLFSFILLWSFFLKFGQFLSTVLPKFCFCCKTVKKWSESNSTSISY